MSYRALALFLVACGSSSPVADPCIAAGTCPPGTWVDVTPMTMPADVLRPTANVFGPGSIVGDPQHASDMYVGGSSAGLWKSTDYGNTWTQINTTLPDVPRGLVIAVAGTTPATIWATGYNMIYKSIDGGVTFAATPLDISLYSLEVDPADPTHLISGLHEADGVYESKDGGATWTITDGDGFPAGGISWFPFFIDPTTWFAIAQDGASAIMTSDSGAHWTTPAGIAGLQHPHGNAALYQNGANMFVGGISGPAGQGVYGSTDRGATWALVDSGQTPEAVVWGTQKNIYAMYAWACASCDLGTSFEVAAQPGTTWTPTAVPAELQIGPNSVVVTNDGTHSIFVALMWDQGLWRYIEP